MSKRSDSRNPRNAVVENLFRAYFIDGVDVGDIDVLKRIGAQGGLDIGRLEELFAAGLGTEELTARRERGLEPRRDRCAYILCWQ